jgi:hypothetical protein
MDDLQQREQRIRQRKSLTDLLIVLVGLLCIMLVATGVGWHYFYGPCGINRVKTAGLALADQFDAYKAAYDVAASTSRIALAGPVMQLQQVKRDTQLLAVPPCMEGAKNELILVVDNSIQAFLEFMSQNDAAVDVYINESASHLAEFRTQLEAVEACKPFCQMK